MRRDRIGDDLVGDIGNAARARQPARLASPCLVASAGSASAPNSASDATSEGCVAAICWQMMVPIEWPTKCADVTPMPAMARMTASLINSMVSGSIGRGERPEPAGRAG